MISNQNKKQTKYSNGKSTQRKTESYLLTYFLVNLSYTNIIL